MIKNAFILVGGLGKRLGKLTKNTPKPLLKINSIPFLDILIRKVLKLKLKKIYLLCGYKSFQFIKKYHNQYFENTKIICIKEKRKLGTGGAIKNIQKLIKDNSFVCNGDSIFDIEFKNLHKINLKTNLVFMCCVKNTNYKSNKKLSNLIVNKNSRVNFRSSTSIMNGGAYIIGKKIKDTFPDKASFSFEEDVLKKLINEGKVIGKLYKSFFIDIGTKKNLNLMKRKTKLL